MYSPSPRRGPASQSEWLFAGIFLAIFLGLFLVEILHDYTPTKLSIVLVVLFWIPLLALHEAGHAVVAWACGWYVGQIVVGMGACLGQFRIGSASVEVRAFPIEGFVRCVPTNLRWPRLKSALIYLAGPGVELLLSLAVLFTIGADRLFELVDDHGLIVWQSLALAAVSQALLNLMPMAARSGDGTIVSDGLGMMLSFLWPTAHYANMIGARYNQETTAWENADDERPS